MRRDYFAPRWKLQNQHVHPELNQSDVTLRFVLSGIICSAFRNEDVFWNISIRYGFW